MLSSMHMAHITRLPAAQPKIVYLQCMFEDLRLVLQKASGDDAVKPLSKGIKLKELLTGDPEFDDTPEAFLSKQGLQLLPL